MPSAWVLDSAVVLLSIRKTGDDVLNLNIYFTPVYGRSLQANHLFQTGQAGEEGSDVSAGLN